MIRIETTPAKIGINRTPEKMEIQNHNEVSLDHRVELGKLEMTTEHVKVMIDQSQCFNESGLKTVSALTEDNVSYSRQQASKGISRIVDQGNQRADIRKKSGNPLPQQAYYNAFELFKKDWNMVTMPRSRPDFDIKEGKVDIKISEPKIENNTKIVKPTIDYQASKVEVYLDKWPSINISVIDIEV